MPTQKDTLFVVKLGGAAITNKNDFESLHNENLRWSAQLIQRMHAKGLPVVIVHGAGSFGHFQAKQYNVSKGLRENPEAQFGACSTRTSVTKLAHAVISELTLQCNVPAIGISPFGIWRTNERRSVTAHNIADVIRLASTGFVPCLHGDVVIDDSLGCTILSGDTIAEEIATYVAANQNAADESQFTKCRVVFITDVDGIFTQPPETIGAKLIRRITVARNGHIDWSLSSSEQKETEHADSLQEKNMAGIGISTSNAAHDVTGGILQKIESAVSIVKQNYVLPANDSKVAFDVFIVKVGSAAAECVCSVHDNEQSDGPVSGTHIGSL